MSRAFFLARNQGFSTDLDDRLEKYYNLFCTVDGFETKILWSKEYKPQRQDEMRKVARWELHRPVQHISLSFCGVTCPVFHVTVLHFYLSRTVIRVHKRLRKTHFLSKNKTQTNLKTRLR
jgi:hypothetical protein